MVYPTDPKAEQLRQSYREVARRLKSEQSSTLRQAMYGASTVNPDAWAKNVEMGNKLGLPADLVDRNKEKLQRQATMQSVDYERLASDYRKTAQWLTSSQDNMNVAQDELETLQRIEEIMEDRRERNSMVNKVLDVPRSFVAAPFEDLGQKMSGAAELYRVAGRNIDKALDAVGLVFPEDSPFSAMTQPTPYYLDPANLLDMPGEALKAIGEEIAPPEERKNFATQVASGVGEVTAQITMALLSPATFVSSEFAQGAEIQAQRAEAAGVAGTAAADQAIVTGAGVTAITEKVGLNFLLERVPPAIKNKIAQKLTDIAIAGGIEAAQETAEGIMQNLTTVANYAPDLPIFDGLAEEAGVAFTVGGIVRTMLHAVRPGRSFTKTEDNQKRLDKLMELSDNSDLRKRSPQKFEEAVGSMAGEGNDSVYVNVQSFNQSFKENAVAKAEELGIIDQYREALATQSDLVIPIERFAAAVNNEDYQSMRDEVRIEAGGLTPREEREAAEQREEMLQALAEIDDGQVVDDSNQIFDDITGQLMSSGRDRAAAESEAKLVQAFFKVMANRAGMETMELYGRYNLGINRPLPEILKTNPEPQAIDEMLDRIRSGDVPTDKDVYGTSLFEFLRDRGGIIDDGGELSSRDIDSDRMPGQRNLARAEGDESADTLDGAAEAAAEAGYITEATPDALLDALDRERSGDLLIGPDYNEQAAGLASEVEQLSEYLDSLGINLEEMDNASVREAMRTGQVAKPAQVDGRVLDQKTPEERGLPLAKVNQFETGKPATFPFVHNTQSATAMFGLPEPGDRYQRDLEPSGRYVIETSVVTDRPELLHGELTFQNPLVIEHDNWKKSLSDAYDGLSGKELSQAIIADGYDGVVTVDRDHTSEIVDLTTFDPSIALYQVDSAIDQEMDRLYEEDPGDIIRRFVAKKRGGFDVRGFLEGDPGAFRQMLDDNPQYGEFVAESGLTDHKDQVRHLWDGWERADIQLDAMPYYVGEQEFLDGLRELATKSVRKGFYQSGRVSTRLPTGPANPEDAINDDLRIEPGAVQQFSPAHFKNATVNIRKAVHTPAQVEVRQFAGFKTRKRNPDAVAEEFIEYAKNNLLWLHDQIPPKIRKRSTQWYVGANKIAHEWGEKYGHDKDTVAAVLAVLSPQRDWHHNVSGAERVLDFWAYQQEFASDDAFAEAVLKQFPPEKVSNKDVAQKQADGLAEITTGKPFKELSHYAQGMMFVTWDKLNNPRDTRVVTPEGGISEESAGTVTMGGVSDYRAAFSSLSNPSYENISLQLGTGNKVRSFFNNIAYPESDLGDVTIDTHAVGAALLQPVSSKAKTVTDTFSPTKAAGGSAYYALIADAYRRAAAERGLKAREMQSITWEAVRALFNDKWKNPSRLGKIAQILDSESIDDAREQILEYAGGIDQPAWVQSSSGRSIGSGGRTYSSSLDGNPISGQSAGRGRPGGRQGAGDGRDRDLQSGSGDGATPQSTEPVQGRAESRELFQSGNIPGGAGLLADPYAENVGDDPQGLPGPVDVPGRGPIQFRSFKPAQEAAQRYAERAGIDYAPPQTYIPPDPQRAAFIADAYEALEHNPDDPEVRAAYEALAAETIEQYKAMLETGIEIEFMPEGQDAYELTPRLAVLDVVENNHLYVFSTRQGFGTDTEFNPEGNPLLAETEFEIGGQKALVNDLFRAVHDYFGHVKDGAGFRYGGETHAWRSHSAMYTPLARRAMSSETVGQNSWVNYGPYGEQNRQSLGADTVFADQKAGLMPADIVESWSNEAEELLQSGDDQPDAPRGRITFDQNKNFNIELLAKADLSTFLHESGHFFLEVFADLAEGPDAPDAIRQDWESTLKWMGVSDRSQIGTEQHEKWAESFEAYLRTGKAPSEELRPIFSRFRAWLLAIYRSLKQLGRADLSPEITDVFDRLIASDEEIEFAKAQQGYDPVFVSAADAGMTKAQFEKYQRQGESARMAAEESMTQRVMDGLARERKDWWNEARKTMREEVEKEVDSQPVYAAMRVLQTGKGALPNGLELPDGQKLKLDRVAIVALKGKEFLKKLPRPYMYANEGGVPPDMIAQLYNFSSADEMLSSMATARDRKELIEAETDQRMLERFGDPGMDGATADKAVEALHNQKQENFLNLEMRALAKKANRTSERALTPSQVMRQAASKKIRNMPIAAIRPHLYRSAEARAGRAAFAAAAKGDYEEAFAQKQRQIFNYHLFKEATRAREEADKALKYTRKFNKKSTRQTIGYSSNAGKDYLDQIDTLLEKYEFRPRSVRQIVEKRKALSDFVKSQAEQGFDIPLDAIDESIFESAPTNYRELTPTQLEAVTDALKMFETAARNVTRLLKSEEKRNLAELLADLNASIEANAAAGKKKQPLESNLPAEFAKRQVRGFFFAHRKAASLLRQMDGFEDAGPLWEAVMLRMNEAADQKTRMNEEISEKLGEILKDYTTVKAPPGQALNSAFGGPMYKPEFIPAINDSLSKWGRMMVALNLGNEDNKRRLMRGYAWTDSQVEAILEPLTEKDFETVQKIWDLIDSFWPQIADKEQRVTGIKPKKVEATPLATRFGELPGGYFPIAYDPYKSENVPEFTAEEIASQMVRGAATRSTTQRGHTKARAEDVNPEKYKVLLDPSVIFRHLDQVTQDLSHHEMLVDTNRIVRGVSKTIREHYGEQHVDALKSVLQDTAAGDVPARHVIEKSLGWLRNGVSVSIMAFNLGSAAMQFAGLSQSAMRLGPRYMGAGVREFLGHPNDMQAKVNEVFEKSDLMRDRASTQNREIADIQNKLRKDNKLTALQDAYFWFMTRAQMMVDVPTWLGAYNKALDAGESDARAAKIADQTVIDTQGSGHIKDLAAIQRGGPSLKLFTVFYSYFSTLYNLQTESVRRFQKEGGVGRLASDFALLYAIPALYTIILKDLIKEGEEEDPFLKRLSVEMGGMALGTTIPLREIPVLSDFSYSGPAGLSFFSTAGRLATQVKQGEADESFWRELNRSAGILFHYPALQVDRTTRGAAAILSGETVDPRVLISGPENNR